MFDQFMNEMDNTHNSFYENAAYYNTVCNIAISNKDALKKVEHFVTDYPESTWLPKIYFELGKFLSDPKTKYNELNGFLSFSIPRITKIFIGR